MVRAKKQLGQHFLTDKNIAKKIVYSLTDFSKNTLEIGPGTGVLSQFLMEEIGEKFWLIEIDHESVDYLNVNFPQLRDRILQKDFLKLDLSSVFEEEFNIIGNLPYNISSQIFFKILEYRQQIPETVAMIQKEVAQRLASPPGNKTYGILSVLLQAYYNIEYLFTVPEHVFNPPPKVKSAVIRLKRNNTKELDCNEALFFKVVKTSFNQRRKTIRNSLKGLFLNLQSDNEIFNKRPEQLSVDDFVYLTRIIQSQELANQ